MSINLGIGVFFDISRARHACACTDLTTFKKLSNLARLRVCARWNGVSCIRQFLPQY
jgi:hypothetical protein